MRVLLIDDDEDLRNLLVALHPAAQWADAQIEDYDPLERDLPDADVPARRVRRA